MMSLVCDCRRPCRPSGLEGRKAAQRHKRRHGLGCGERLSVHHNSFPSLLIRTPPPPLSYLLCSVMIQQGIHMHRRHHQSFFLSEGICTKSSASGSAASATVVEEVDAEGEAGWVPVEGVLAPTGICCCCGVLTRRFGPKLLATVRHDMMQLQVSTQARS